jgi:hypothetical protein
MTPILARSPYFVSSGYTTLLESNLEINIGTGEIPVELSDDGLPNRWYLWSEINANSLVGNESVEGNLRVTMDVASGDMGVSYAMTTVIGKTYTIKANLTKSSGDTVYIRVSTDAAMTANIVNESTTLDALNIGTTFVATATTHYVGVKMESVVLSKWFEINHVSVTSLTIPTPTYKLLSTPVYGSASYDISNIVRDYVDNVFTGTYNSTPVWVYYKLTEIDSNDVTLQSTKTLIVFDGYSYFEEGRNFEFTSPNMFSNSV